MTVIIKGHTALGHTYAPNNGRFEYTLDELSITQEEWDNYTEKERQEILSDVLETEISNVLDCSIDYEEQ